MRIAVEAAGTNGSDGYFDVKCFGEAATTCAANFCVGRRIRLRGCLHFEERTPKAGAYVTCVDHRGVRRGSRELRTFAVDAV